jgi:hypothetical protein
VRSIPENKLIIVITEETNATQNELCITKHPCIIARDEQPWEVILVLPSRTHCATAKATNKQRWTPQQSLVLDHFRPAENNPQHKTGVLLASGTLHQKLVHLFIQY